MEEHRSDLSAGPTNGHVREGRWVFQGWCIAITVEVFERLVDVLVELPHEHRHLHRGEVHGDEAIAQDQEEIQPVHAEETDALGGR